MQRKKKKASAAERMYVLRSSITWFFLSVVDARHLCLWCVCVAVVSYSYNVHKERSLPPLSLSLCVFYILFYERSMSCPPS